LQASHTRAALVFCAFFVTPLLVFASQIGVSSLSVAAGTSILVPVSFSGQTSSVSGIQFDVQFDASAMSLGAILGDPGANAGKGLYAVNIAPGTKRILIVGQNQNAIPDGTIVNFFINVSPVAASGVYALRFSNIAGTDPSGQATAVAGIDGALTVQGIAGTGPQLQLSGVRSAGSWLAGPVAPGEIITLVGQAIGPASAQLPSGSVSSTILGGTSVLFDGTPAPLLYAGPTQINAVVPYGVSGKAAAQLQVMAQGQPQATLSVPVTPAAPAIFTLDSSGVGPGAILNQDMTVNSPFNAAAKGSVIVIYATGAGQTNPLGIDGQIASGSLSHPLLGVSVQIGGFNSSVLYAGAAPELISGALQVNAIVPDGVSSGASVPLQLTIGTVVSQTGVTVAVR
jgi:uncharacterized protein (TIGR03437 family)